MVNEGELNRLTGEELKILEITLIASATRTAVTVEELVNIGLLQGIAPDVLEQQLRDDLLNGGRIFGEFRRAISSNANGTINRFRDISEFSELGTDIKYKWVAVLVNTCADCVDRHQRGAHTWDDWRAIGLPRTNHTICKQNCRCVMIPEDTVDIEPVKRPKGRR